MATATAPKQSPATLKIELRGGKRIYKLAARERAKLVNMMNLCGDLAGVDELKELADEASVATGKLLAYFPSDE